MKDMVIVDMFCGAGGASQGIKEALEALGLKARMFAINRGHPSLTGNGYWRPLPCGG
jgi:site-specific DNA-cytosine methylase